MEPSKSLVARALVLGSVTLASPLRADLPSGLGWHELPNTQLRTVCAADNGFPEVHGAEGCSGITADWSGGVFDTRRNRLIIWGGGHNGYYGNELYALDLDTQIMERLNDPGLPTSQGVCVEAIANGTQPNSRHTYDGIEYLPTIDKMFVFGGAVACTAGGIGRDTWLFDFQTMQWERKNPSGTIPQQIEGILTAFDPVSGLIYLYDNIHFYSYDAEQDRFTQLTTSVHTMGYHLNATIDPVRRKFLIIGFDNIRGDGRVWSIDIGAGSSYEVTAANTTGGAGLINTIYPGVDYDTSADRIIGWGQDTPGTVYSLNLDTYQWTAIPTTGYPTPVGQGTHGRWRFSPVSNVFVVANRVDDNIFIYRFKSPNSPSPLIAE